MKLIIVPSGIEIAESKTHKRKQRTLIIVPSGIEIIHGLSM